MASDTAAGPANPAIGVNIVGSTLNAGTGNATITGQALPSGAGGYGVMISDGNSDGFTSITGNNIDIYGWVDGNGAELRRGVYMTGPASIVSATHALTITGVAGSACGSVPAVLLAVVLVVLAMGVEHEIAGAVAYLGSDASTFMTGQTIVVDGGVTTASV